MHGEYTPVSLEMPVLGRAEAMSWNAHIQACLLSLLHDDSLLLNGRPDT